jgi:hypothetical protein
MTPAKCRGMVVSAEELSPQCLWCTRLVTTGNTNDYDWIKLVVASGDECPDHLPERPEIIARYLKGK